MKRPSASPTRANRAIRCAIYTRKSTEEGLEQEFNSLDAQRESAEAYILSQSHEGWECLADRYDDGGYTGGNMDRPALKRLLDGIEAGQIDCVVVYKVDRLSRSLMDFARMMATFERHEISFVSVTQQFSTASSMGRLLLHILLSFSQFERETISERTRDKIAATRRKGKWSGGAPILGYDVVQSKLVVNEPEAQRVRQMFDLYLERQSVLAVVDELQRRGWTTKIWSTKSGAVRGGRPFTKNRLYQLLTNVTYVGQVRYKDEVHPGEHQAIIDADRFREVQALLARNGSTGGTHVRNNHGALLKGLLCCAACHCAMAHSFSTKGPRRYRYYVCTRAQQMGRHACPSPSVPAGEIERFVVDQIRELVRDPVIVSETLIQCQQQADEQARSLVAERETLSCQLRQDGEELGRLAGANGPDTADALAQVQDRLAATRRRLAAIEAELAKHAADPVDATEVASALTDFDGLWSMLTPREQARVVELLVERVEYDGAHENVSITFRPTGLESLGAELQRRAENVA